MMFIIPAPIVVRLMTMLLFLIKQRADNCKWPKRTCGIAGVPSTYQHYASTPHSALRRSDVPADGRTPMKGISVA